MRKAGRSSTIRNSSEYIRFLCTGIVTERTELEWVALARKFIATGAEPFLAQAIEICEDHSLREFLARPETMRGAFADEPLKGVVFSLTERLKSEARWAEAATVEILSLRFCALGAASLDKFTFRARDAVADACMRVITLSKEQGFAECEARFSSKLGTGLAKYSQWQVSRALLERSVDLYGQLARTEPDVYIYPLANSMNDLGNVYCLTRQFPLAVGIFCAALAVRLGRARQGDRSLLCDLAGAYASLGMALADMGQFSEAGEAYDKAIHIYHSLPDATSEENRAELATTLNNMAQLFCDAGKCQEARPLFEEALVIRLSLAESAPDFYAADVAATLRGHATALVALQEYDEARKLMGKAIDIYRSLAKPRPDVYNPDLASSLSNAAVMNWQLRDEEKALRLAREALRIAERWPPGGPTSRHLVKGHVQGAYQCWLAHSVRSGEEAPIFRCLSAMRDGALCALPSEEDESLGSTIQALKHVEVHVGKPVTIVVIETILEKECVIGLVSSSKPHFKVVRADSFAEHAYNLFNAVSSIFDDRRDHRRKVSRQELGELGSRAWSALPGSVRKVLDPSNHGDVLISGGRYWTAFPWEAVCLTRAPDGWLGVHRPLVRWGGVSAKAVRKLRQCVMGRSARLGAIFCPWDAVSGSLLPAASREAQKLESELLSLEYRLLPTGAAMVGQNATAGAFLDVLRHAPAVIHFTGHGSIFFGEEVLVVSGGSAGKGPFFLGKIHLDQLKGPPEQGTPLFEHGTIVVLNSCQVGQTRRFGGNREDLVWGFISRGAEAVIASALPLDDDFAYEFGVLLYDRRFTRDGGMAQTFQSVRKYLATESRKCDSFRPSWMLYTYHGNPYALLPHQSSSGAGRHGVVSGEKA